MKILFSLLLVFVSLFAEPFFDNDEATKLSPKLPVLEPLDKEILSLCGNFGDEIDKVAFKRFIKGYDNGRFLNTLYDVFKKDFSSKDNFVEEFTKIWFQEDAFAHIFCGEPKNDGYLGGLHYFARINELYDKGLLKKVSIEQENVADDTYTVGMEYKQKNTPFAKSKNPKSYNTTMNAQDILIEATEAFLYHYKKVGNNKKGLTWFVNRSQNYNKHKAKIVIKNGAIVTFYPIK